MSKVKVKAITRWQKFLAAIAGDAVAPNPVTDREKLMYNIAEKVNEGGGSGGGVLVVNDVADTLDKTWQEIHDAMLSGGAVIQTGETNVWTVISVGAGNEQYLVIGAGDSRYSTSSASGYPTRIR